MISNTTNLFDPEVGQRRERPKATADYLLSLAAAPTFAIVALLTGVLAGPPPVLCAAAQSSSPLSGMALMYLLMSAFHSAPWLKLILSRRSGAALVDCLPLYGVFWRERFANLRTLLKEIDP
jgi:hypothetical protein